MYVHVTILIMFKMYNIHIIMQPSPTYISKSYLPSGETETLYPLNITNNVKQ